MTRIIGFAGYKTAGKSTAAVLLKNALAELFNSTSGVFSFAEPIKKMIHALLYPILPEKQIEYYMKDPIGKEAPIPGLGVSYRKLATTLGTEWGRNTISTDFWPRLLDVRTSVKEIQLLDYILIDDVRFENEVSMIHKKGGIVAFVETPEHIATKSDHASEKFNPEWADYFIVNRHDGLANYSNEILASLSSYLT